MFILLLIDELTRIVDSIPQYVSIISDDFEKYKKYFDVRKSRNQSRDGEIKREKERERDYGMLNEKRKMNS